MLANYAVFKVRREDAFRAEPHTNRSPGEAGLSKLNSTCARRRQPEAAGTSASSGLGRHARNVNRVDAIGAPLERDSLERR